MPISNSGSSDSFSDTILCLTLFIKKKNNSLPFWFWCARLHVCEIGDVSEGMVSSYTVFMQSF